MDASLDNDEGIDRRSMLRKTAMGGAVVWATPVVLTLGQGVAAASTLTYVACPGVNQGNPPRQLTFKWTGAACSGSDGPAFVNSTGNPDAYNGPIDWTATHGTGNFAATTSGTNVAVNSNFTVGNGTNSMTPNTFITLYEAGTPTVIRTIQIHTSCSQPLNLNDTFCGIELVGGF